MMKEEPNFLCIKATFPKTLKLLSSRRSVVVAAAAVASDIFGERLRNMVQFFFGFFLQKKTSAFVQSDCGGGDETGLNVVV